MRGPESYESPGLCFLSKQEDRMNTTVARHYRLIVVESQSIVGKALCHLLASDRELEIICHRATLDQGCLPLPQPDLPIIDMDDFAAEFDEIISQSRLASPATRIIVLTSHAQQQSMQRCLACGVGGYLVKDVSPGELIRACKAVARGETYFDPRVAGGLLRRLKSDRPPGDG